MCEKALLLLQTQAAFRTHGQSQLHVGSINSRLRAPLGHNVLTLTAFCTDPPSFDIVDALRTQQNDSRWGHYVQQVRVNLSH